MSVLIFFLLSPATSQAPPRTISTRNTRSKAKDLEGGLERANGQAAYKRRRGLNPSASAYLQKTLNKIEVEKDISLITADDEFALEDPGMYVSIYLPILLPLSSAKAPFSHLFSHLFSPNPTTTTNTEDDEGDLRPNIVVRVERTCVVYGDLQLHKNDGVLVTMPRTDDQYFATVQSFNNTEVGR